LKRGFKYEGILERGRKVKDERRGERGELSEGPRWYLPESTLPRQVYFVPCHRSSSTLNSPSCSFVSVLTDRLFQMACLNRRHSYVVYPAVWCYILLWGRASSQLQDTGYLDPNRFGDRERYSSGGREGLLNDRILTKFLETQDPKYFQPGLFPERRKPQDDLPVDRVHDDTPPSYKVNYIPLQELKNLLFQVDLDLSQECTANVDAQWNFETNVNEATQLQAVSLLLNMFIYFPLKGTSKANSAYLIRVLK
jgi:hypothetical protein